MTYHTIESLAAVHKKIVKLRFCVLKNRLHTQFPYHLHASLGLSCSALMRKLLVTEPHSPSCEGQKPRKVDLPLEVHSAVIHICVDGEQANHRFEVLFHLRVNSHSILDDVGDEFLILGQFVVKTYFFIMYTLLVIDSSISRPCGLRQAMFAKRVSVI